MVDAALTRLFHARMALGLFDDPKTIAYSTLGQDDIFSGPHKAAALEMSEKALVLVRPPRWLRLGAIEHASTKLLCGPAAEEREQSAAALHDSGQDAGGDRLGRQRYLRAAGHPPKPPLLLTDLPQ